MTAVTVGISCYNVEAWIEECMESVLGQTFKDLDVVAVDDGSTDRTGELLDAFAARDPRVRVTHQKNAGLGPVKNYILQDARGTYVTFVDGDDKIAPECVEETYRRAATENLDILAFGWVRFDDATGRTLRKRFDHERRNVGRREGMRKHAFSADLNPMSCSNLVRTSLYRTHDLSFPATVHEDVYVTPFLYFYGEKYGYLDKDLYFWRVRGNSITGYATESHVDAFADAFDAWKERLSLEGQWRAFRSAAVEGIFNYFATAHQRIEARDDATTVLRHLENRILSIPELQSFEMHTTRREKKWAPVIDVIENARENARKRTAACRRLYDSNAHLRGRLDALRAERGAARAGVAYDICFAPHKEYHVVTAHPVAEVLRRRGIEVSFLDFTSLSILLGRKEGSKKTLERLGERHWYDVADFLTAGHGFDVLVVFNDWDPLVTRPLVMDARDAGAATVGFVEGINDFHDADTGRRRDAYRTAEWVLGAGENDRRYFRDVGSRFHVVGFPRIAPLLERPVQPPERMRAVINVNFTYNVLENERSRWLDSAVEGCRLAGLEWIVSQHPQDRADLSSYPVDRRGFEESMRENAILISRFSSCIMEALAMGRPVVYYNPHKEKVDKFREPLGAYGLASDPPGLARAIRSELERANDLAARRMKFLAEHCDVSRRWRPHEKAAATLEQIFAEHRSKQTTGATAWRGDRSDTTTPGRAIAAAVAGNATAADEPPAVAPE